MNSIRGELDWIVMKALEKDRNRHAYETANGLAADLRRFFWRRGRWRLVRRRRPGIVSGSSSGGTSDGLLLVSAGLSATTTACGQLACSLAGQSMSLLQACDAENR